MRVIMEIFMYVSTYVSMYVGMQRACLSVRVCFLNACKHQANFTDLSNTPRSCNPPKNGLIALWPNTRVVKCKYYVLQNPNVFNNKGHSYSILLTFKFKWEFNGLKYFSPVISVKIERLPCNNKNGLFTRSWTARVRLFHSWAAGWQRLDKQGIEITWLGSEGGEGGGGPGLDHRRARNVGGEEAECTSRYRAGDPQDNMPVGHKQVGCAKDDIQGHSPGTTPRAGSSSIYVYVWMHCVLCMHVCIYVCM